MDLDQLKQILDLVRQHELSEFEVEHDGLRLKIRKDAAGPVAVAPTAAATSAPPVQAIAAAPQSAAATVAPTAAPPKAEGIELAIVKSPIVGTFYRAPEPEAASFVEVGTRVKKGQVLCIIEAMKLMNEIEVRAAGRVSKILVENGQAVEYGQPLFLIEPAR